METYQKIEAQINAVKEYNQEAGNTLHDQMHTAQNSVWTNEDLSELIKGEEDVADEHYPDGDSRHAEIREIQDAIISFYSE